jgi:hypothetical protein
VIIVLPRWFLTAIWTVPLAVLVAHCATVLTGTIGCEGVQIRSDELTIPEAEEYCRYAVAERKKVEEFWGATWSEPIRIHVSSTYRISRALVPGYFGNRGFMEMPLRGVRGRSGPLLHEIAHIYAPNGNRFLAEGLAVYLHATLAGNPAFPNFGRNLKHLASRHLSELDSLRTLNGVQTPRPLSTVMDEKAAYILAGSFVGFLIERYSLPKFRSLYDIGNYAEVYGTPLETLEQEWRMELRGK